MGHCWSLLVKVSIQNVSASLARIFLPDCKGADQAISVWPRISRRVPQIRGSHDEVATSGTYVYHDTHIPDIDYAREDYPGG